MFEIIQAVRPDYIIGENVPGLLSIEGGMVFEQVCLDLESEGYEVQAFILPACATGAPHRRDRVWIVGYSKEAKQQRTGGTWPGRIGLADTNSGLIADTQQIGHRGRSNANSLNEEREIHQDFGHNRNGIRSETEGCDRVTQNSGSSRCGYGINGQQGNIGNFGKPGTGGNEWDIDAEDDSDTNESGLRRESNTQQQPAGATGNYWHDWPSISPFHSGHDGLSPELVRHIRASLSEVGETPENIEAYIRKEANWLRKQAIMAAGNAVVPTVVLQVMKAIQNHYDLPRPN